MKSVRINSEANNFTSCDEQLVAWKVYGSVSDDEDSSHNWQFESCTIATIAEAEDFASKLAKAIDGAKARLALAKAAAEKIIEERAKECGTLAMEPNGDFTVTIP